MQGPLHKGVSFPYSTLACLVLGALSSAKRLACSLIQGETTEGLTRALERLLAVESLVALEALGRLARAHWCE